MIRLLAPSSHIEQVIPEGSLPELPPVLFGAEPAHGWCYYYERAELARQAGDWQAVAALYAEAEQLALQPGDRIEWMPFLQAYAALGDRETVKALAARINVEPLYKSQACTNLRGMPAAGNPLPADMQAYSDEIFCNAGK
jgi:hypothetical protein